MKKTLLLLSFLATGAVGLRAQLTLQPGATWLFRSQMWGVPYGEKWEYQGTSGSTITMQVTTKCLGNPPVCSTPESVTTKQFLVTADKVELDGITVADFSLQTGDVTNSPYAHLSPQDSSACVSLYTAPAKVTQSGTETVNGQTSRYYVLQYLYGVMDGDSLWSTRKYSEYAWIEAGYWYFADEWPISNECPIIDPYVYRDLECYYDNQFAAPAVCDQDWFTKMGITEEKMFAASVYPNPTTERLTITLPAATTPATYEVVSLEGKRLHAGRLTNAQVDVSHLASGYYFLLLRQGEQAARISFVKE